MTSNYSETNEKPFVMVKCVVCGGRGRVNWGKEPCKACKEKGYILIDSMTGRVVGEENELLETTNTNGY